MQYIINKLREHVMQPHAYTKDKNSVADILCNQSVSQYTNTHNTQYTNTLYIKQASNAFEATGAFNFHLHGGVVTNVVHPIDRLKDQAMHTQLIV